MNKITVLTNNVIVIGYTTNCQDGVLIKKPHSIRTNQDGYELVPLFAEHIGQSTPELSFKDIHILTSVEAENNDLLQAYLKKISGIVIDEKPGLLI